jgi:hypothetical protein
MLDLFDGFVGDEGCQPKRYARRVEMESAVSGVLLPVPFTWLLSIFLVYGRLDSESPNNWPNRVSFKVF